MPLMDNSNKIGIERRGDLLGRPLSCLFLSEPHLLHGSCPALLSYGELTRGHVLKPLTPGPLSGVGFFIKVGRLRKGRFSPDAVV